MYWPGSGGGSAASAGQMIPGAARAFFDVQSRVSANSDGCLMQTSDTSRLFGVNSNGTMFLGGAFTLEQAVHPGANTARWVLASGTTTGSLISFGVTYNGLPAVTVSLQTTVTSGSTIGVPVMISVTPTTATPVVYNLAGAQFGVGTWLFHWQSLGTVTF